MTIARRFAGDEQRAARQAHLSAMVDTVAPGTRVDWTPPAEQKNWTPAPAPAAPKPKKTNAEKRQAAKDRRRRTIERNDARDRAHAVKLEKRATDEGWNATDPITLALGSKTKTVHAKLLPLRVVAWWIQLAMWAVLLDYTGGAARFRLGKMRNKVLAGWTRRIAYAAADRREARGKRRGNVWADLRARRVVAAGFFFDAMAEQHRKQGRWLCHVDGVPVAFLSWLHRDPTQDYPTGCYLPEHKPGNVRAYRSCRGVPSQSSMTGVSRTLGRWEDGTAGIVESFRQVGAIFTRANVALDQKYATRSGYQPNDYLIVSDVVEHHEHSAELSALVAWHLDVERSDERRAARAPPASS